MTWALTASGSAKNAEAERELRERLTEVLSDPKYGTAGSQLGSDQHNGPVHQAPKKPLRKPE